MDDKERDLSHPSANLPETCVRRCWFRWRRRSAGGTALASGSPRGPLAPRRWSLSVAPSRRPMPRTYRCVYHTSIHTYKEPALKRPESRSIGKLRSVSFFVGDAVLTVCLDYLLRFGFGRTYFRYFVVFECSCSPRVGFRPTFLSATNPEDVK